MQAPSPVGKVANWFSTKICISDYRSVLTDLRAYATVLDNELVELINKVQFYPGGWLHYFARSGN
jgi:hypothetical protein